MKVLIVDDEQDVRRIAKLSLTRIGGMEVLEVTNGFDCLECAANTDPDVILLDVMMPGMDGPTTLKGLRSDPLTAQIPVIFVTAKALRSETDSLCNLGAAGVVVKPFDPLQLANEIRAILQPCTVH